MNPSEKIVDSVRMHLMWHRNSDHSYESLRYHLKRSGVDTSIYPSWYTDSADDDHVTSGAMSILLYLTFKKAEGES